MLVVRIDTRFDYCGVDIITSTNKTVRDIDWGGESLQVVILSSDGVHSPVQDSIHAGFTRHLVGIEMGLKSSDIVVLVGVSL